MSFDYSSSLDTSPLYSSRQQPPLNQPPFGKHQAEFSYDGSSAVTPSVEGMQSWFDSNYTMSPYNLTNQPTPSPFTFSQPHYAAYQQPPSNHSSSSSSGGSTFSSPQSYPAPSPSHLQQDGYFADSGAYSSSSGSGSPPQMSIDTSLLDGGMGYEAFKKLREERVECGFSGFFNCNSGMEMSETVGSLLRQPSFSSRRGSLASSEASYDSSVSEPTPLHSIVPTTTTSSYKRSHSPVVESQQPTSRRVSATSSTSTSSRKRVKLSPSSPTLSSYGTSSQSNEHHHNLPPLPSDFDTFGPNGSSLFDDSPSSRSGRATTPDFSGRDDCWGIGREAYNKLSAKAKKQLRNKIGARRFRERRKEYITTLEGKLAERDGIIGEFRGRLSKSLDEVAALKLKLAQLEGRS